MLVMLGTAMGLALFAISSATDMFAFGKEDRQIEITIEKGMSVSEIARLLNNEGVINHPLTFKTYAKLRECLFRAGNQS